MYIILKKSVKNYDLAIKRKGRGGGVHEQTTGILEYS